MANSTMKIELNGTLLNGVVDGVQNFTVVLRNRAEDGTLAKSFSSELTFYDDGYQILKTALIDDPFGFSKSVAIKIFDDCCHEAVFEGIIKGDAIDWCEPKCFISANVIEDEAKINCIKSTLIWDNWNGFLGRSHPIIRYCIETRPEFFQYLLINLAGLIRYLFYGIILTFIPVLFGVFTLIYVICNIINAIASVVPGIDSIDCNSGFNNPITAIQEILSIMDDINFWLIPCGRFHPSAYVRDYINNACQKCGLTFQSSIFAPSSPYYNAVLFSSQIKKGKKFDSTDYRLIEDNLPVETLETFFTTYLKPVFNAEFQIVGNTLIFERKDYFNSTVNWIDTESLLNQNKILNNEICFNWIDKERWAFGNFQYSMDFMDYVGNEAKQRYNEIVEWNSPYNPSQKGQREILLQLSAARHRDDGIDQTIFDYFQSAMGGLLNFIYNGLFSNYDKTLLMNQHVSGLYKLLIYEPSEGTNGIVKHDYSNAFCGGDPDAANGERFNYPFWFKEGYQNNLYTLFHYIDDPRRPGTTQFEFKFTFEFDCTTYNDFNFSKTIRLIKNGQIVNGVVKELSVDFAKRTIQVTGIV